MTESAKTHRQMEAQLEEIWARCLDSAEILQIKTWQVMVVWGRAPISMLVQDIHALSDDMA